MKKLEEETLFVSAEDFKGYSKRRKLTFLKKMKAHRLMRNQSVEWGYGSNYLSQMYFKLRNEEKEEKEKKQENKGAKLRGAAQKEKGKEGNTKKEVVVQMPTKGEEKKEEVIEKMEEVTGENTSKIKIEASSISMELALGMITDLRKQFGKSHQSEFTLSEGKDGCDLVFTAQELS